jgi:peptidoglycan-associated lipoprotein
MKKSLSALLAIGVVLSLAATGCTPKDKKRMTVLPPGTTRATATGTNTGPETVPAVPGGHEGPTGVNIPGANSGDLPPRSGLDGMTPDAEIFKGNTVYFEFDRSALRQGEQDKVQAVARVLKERPTTKVQIEGHCDERGTEEYNRSLGEKRALAIREYLLNLGIEGSRVFTLSFGEDKPAVQGHNDEAWAKNRRGVFILYSKP